ncbi:MAG: hypothetical protein ACKVZJ_16055 [Phycisphaerales bacterium]
MNSTFDHTNTRRSLLGRALGRLLGRATATRRGTIIVLALGVLAILAISAVSYVAIVRIDRTAVVSGQRELRTQPQVDTVVAEIGAVLTADLFGNKIVDANTPANVWPSAFEDGDYTDRPHVDGDWALAPAAVNPSTQMRLPFTTGANIPIAKADDAWLAAATPVINEATFLDSYWPQITNLRSAWRYQPRSGSRVEQWKRDNGQYVDLMQFFLRPTTTGNANASADLTANNAFGPELGTAFITRGNGAQPLDQRDPLKVFGVQMNRVENDFSDINSVSNDQERFWTDTDGDLRPDARWQRLDALGNAYGLTWVVAARVIDASALINFNTALTFPHKDLIGVPLRAGRTWADVVGTGETPADVDLFRLLGYGAPTSGAARLPDTFGTELNAVGTIWPAPMETRRLADQGVSPALRAMVGVSLGFGSTMRKVSEELKATTDADFNPPYELRLSTRARGVDRYPEQEYADGFENTTNGWGPMDFPTASQRAVWYRLVSAEGIGLVLRSIQPITIRDFADLHAFRATNNAEVTGKLEQYVDGTETNGFLPGSGNINAPYGPLRSREGTEGTNPKVARSPRRFGSPDQDDSNVEPGLPTIRQLKWDNRHLLTPVSGTGRIGPVPVLNTQAYSQNLLGRVTQPSYFDGRRSLERINIPELERQLRSTPSRDVAQRVFDAFVWALAPLSTDKPQSRELGVNNLFNNGADNVNRHYGGGTNGPAQKLITDAGLTATAGSTYAVLKSLCLTANLIDALGLGGGSPLVTNEAPTSLKLYNENDLALPVAPGVPALGTRLAQGNIPPVSLDEKVFGSPGVAGGVSVFGVDRQPFLVQASYYAFYEDSDAISETVTSPSIDPTDAEDQLGSIMAFEIRNPWPQSIDLSGYKIVMRNTAAPGAPELVFDLGEAPEEGTAVVSSGEPLVVYFVRGPSNPVFAPFWRTDTLNAVEEFNELIESQGAVAVRYTETAISGSSESAPGTRDPIAGAALPVIFAEYLVGATPVNTIPVLLVREAIGSAGGEALIDRLSAPITGENFPQLVTATHTATPLPDETPVPPGPDLTPTMRARMLVASSIYRPTESSAAPNPGMPPYIAERRSANISQFLAPSSTTLTYRGTATIDRQQVWRVGPPGLPVEADPGPDGLVGDPGGALGDIATWQPIGIAGKGVFPVATRFQLFNPTPGFASADPSVPLPDGGNLPPPMPSINSAADLLLIPSVATVYVHAAAGPAVLADASDLLASYTGNTIAFATGAVTGKGAWVTASEMLGSDWELFRNAVAATDPSPYVGVLDPTQSILSSVEQLGPQSVNLPDNLTIPLALRVLDAFDGLDHRGDLAAGRVNLNTAPARVLACLPFLSPLTAVQNADDQNGAGFQASSLPAPTNPADPPANYPLLGRWLLPYRSLNLENPISPPSLAPTWRDTNIALPGLRNRTGQPKELGLVSVGELGIMGTWNNTNGNPAATNDINTNGFMHVGSNGLPERGVPFGRLGNPDRQVPDAFRLVDGPEERAALLRALSNIATTRSDVFIAWFQLRGYNPDVIESIEVNGSGAPPTLAQARDAMNNEKFRPTVDTRWLVVYDRSNVRNPTDRPNIILKMELPSAKP